MDNEPDDSALSLATIDELMAEIAKRCTSVVLAIIIDRQADIDRVEIRVGGGSVAALGLTKCAESYILQKMGSFEE